MFSILCVLLLNPPLHPPTHTPLFPLPSGCKQGMLMNCNVKFNPFCKVKTIFLLAEGLKDSLSLFYFKNDHQKSFKYSFVSEDSEAVNMFFAIL